MSKYLALFLLMFSSSSFASANKWVDANGQIHYSDKLPPPQAVAVKRVGPNTPDMPGESAASSVAAASAVPAANGKASAEKEAAAKKAAAAKAEQEAAIKAQNEANCSGAKQNLANLKDGMRIATIDPATGERSYIDDTQRAKSIAEAQDQISKFCK